MLSRELKIALAVFLDLIIGDPVKFPHPVQFFAFLAGKLEKVFRKISKNGRITGRTAGICMWFGVISITCFLIIFIIRAAYGIHFILGDVLSVYFLYTALAARGLADHGWKVYSALRENDLPLARKRVGMICSRETGSLDVEGISRSAVESIAENVSDGVIGPLLFALAGGPAGAMLYKAVNTLDSLVGYKNEKYREIGWFSAKADDIVNFIPSRITGFFICAAAFITGSNGKQAWRIMMRDARKHSSPNAGYPEAAAAGALNIRLGGKDFYFGKLIAKPCLGDPGEPVQPVHIKKVIQLFFFSYGLSLLFFTGIPGIIRIILKIY